MSDMHSLVPFPEAQARILSRVEPLAAEWVRVEDALGRALCADQRARRTLPPWDNSAMDGYALRSEDAQAGARLKVVEKIFAGHRSTRTLGKGECARIMTGAPVPLGSDAVEMQEKVQVHAGEGLGTIELTHAVPSGANVRSAGEDAREGEVLLPSGTPLGIPEAALLWAQGISEVEVPRRPRVAIVSTGDELCRPDQAQGDRIVDTNARALALAARRMGCEVAVLGIAPDVPGALDRLLETGFGYDVLLTSAGVSVGEKDFVRPTLERLGVELAFFGVAIKPGKPLAFGRRGKTFVFGLPGNPLSSLVTFELFVRPALRRMQGRLDALPRWAPGRYDAGPGGRPFTKKPGLSHFVRVTTTWRDDALWATPLSSQTSGALRSGAGATHLLHVPSSIERLEPGATVQLLPLDWGT